MTPTDEAIQSVRTGMLVDCTAKSFPRVRKALLLLAIDCLKDGNNRLAREALENVVRLNDEMRGV